MDVADRKKHHALPLHLLIILPKLIVLKEDPSLVIIWLFLMVTGKSEFASSTKSYSRSRVSYSRKYQNGYLKAVRARLTDPTSLRRWYVRNNMTEFFLGLFFLKSTPAFGYM